MNLLGLLRDGAVVTLWFRQSTGQVQQTVSLNGERATTALPEEVLMSDLLSTHKIIEEFNSDHIIASITMEKSFMHIHLMDSSTGKYAEDKVTYEDYKYSAHPTTILRDTLQRLTTELHNERKTIT